jgi:hypothetical protein
MSLLPDRFVEKDREDPNYSHDDPQYILWSAIAYTVSCQELSMRNELTAIKYSDFTQPIISRDLKSIISVGFSTAFNNRQNFHKISRELWRILNGESEEMSPLSLDAFGTFVRFVYVLDQLKMPIQEHDLLKLIHLILPIELSKALLTIAVYTAAEPLKSEPPITDIYSFILTNVKLPIATEEAPRQMPKSQELIDHIQVLLLPFLRRCLMFTIHACQADAAIRSELTALNSVTSIDQEFSQLWKALKVPPMDMICAAAKRVLEMRNNSEAIAMGDYRLIPAGSFQFIEMEASFQTLLTKYKNRTCKSCHKVPTNPALCMFCGGKNKNKKEIDQELMNSKK